MEPGVVLHITGGAVAIVAGYAALAFRKGARGHRLAGRIFVAAMLVMAGMGGAMGALRGQPGNVIAGAIACYLVRSAQAAVRKPGAFADRTRLRRHIWRMCLALFVATGSFFLGQADEIPTALRGPHLTILALAPLAALIFWMARTRGPIRRRPAAPA